MARGLLFQDCMMSKCIGEKNAIKLRLNFIVGTLITLVCLFTFTGCFEAISTFTTGAVVTAQYILTGDEPRTLCHNFDLTKKAVLVALCRMNITVENAREIENGEEISARAGKLEIRVELKLITPTVTYISVKAEENLLNRDKATAREIVRQAAETAERLESGASQLRNAQI